MNKIGKVFTLVITILTLGFGFTSQGKATEKRGLEVSKKEVKIKEGKSFTIKSKGKATVEVRRSSKGKSLKLSVTSSNNKIVEIKKIDDTSYKVKALKTGKATILIKNEEDTPMSEKIVVKVVKKTKKKLGLRTLTMKNFEKEVVKAKGRVAIMFGTEWCHYCKLLDPIYKKAAEKDAKVKYYRVDAEKEENLSALFGITAYPYVYLLENDKTIDVTGYLRNWNEDDYIRWANEKKVQR